MKKPVDFKKIQNIGIDRIFFTDYPNYVSKQIYCCVRYRIESYKAVSNSIFRFDILRKEMLLKMRKIFGNAKLF